MPNGTIQDSRNPTSPQWGYLKVENRDKNEFDKHAEKVDPGNNRGLRDKGRGPRRNANPWNRFIKYVNVEKTSGIRRLERNDRVEFEMIALPINIRDETSATWVASVLRPLK